MNVEKRSINIHWFDFHFQPNINVEATLVHRRWIDIILYTLFHCCFANVETISMNFDQRCWDRYRGHVTNKKCYISTFTRRKAHKLFRVVTILKRHHPTCYVTPQLHCYVTTIQQVVYICSTSS